MRPLTVEICACVTFFQRRLTWMLSSVLQQQGDVPDIIFNVGYPINNGNPATEKVCDFFEKKGLNIRRVPFDGMEVIQYRGLARNKQLEVATGDWILWVDADMVYDKFFFDDLHKKLKGELKDEEKCISAGRISLSKPFCKDYFNNEDPHKYPCVVENAADIVSKWPLFKRSRNVGAGYFQLARRDIIVEKLDNLYVDPKNCADWSWGRMQKANSDKQFRRRMGGLKKIKTLPQYHLNHERDNEEGYHLTLQR